MQYVITLVASDEDQNSTIEYSILEGLDGSKYSILNGTISFIDTPDFESPTDNNNDNISKISVEADPQAANDRMPVQLSSG